MKSRSSGGSGSYGTGAKGLAALPTSFFTTAMHVCVHKHRPDCVEDK